MLKLRNILPFLFFLAALPSLAQETPIYTDPVSYYTNGLELYDKEKFGAAIVEFETYLAKGSEFELRINAQFYIAFCHNELDHKDAEQQILNLLEEHPDHPKANYARFVLGRSYYNRGNTTKSLQYLGETQYLNLTPDDRKAYSFFYGYGLFTKNEYAQARQHLQHIEKNKDKFYYPTQYYLGYMDLSEDKNESALNYFSRLYKSKVYSELAYKYSCLAYYKLGRYQDLIAYSDTLPTNTYSQDIFWERGKAFYQLGQAQEALNNFNKGRGSRELAYDERYMLGMVHYQLKDYENAYVHFTSISHDSSELKQNAMMHAGDCFLKLDKKTNARNAFYEASRLETDKKMQEEAHFNYAKLSLEPPFQNEAVGILNKFVETWPNSVY
ncbi:MAG: tetratricopeptide repeat protein, partial [Bacteroidota bacterium]|nr:tetratricopeptide repeat protein [Bacteroidota bacterium]MDX5431205.1 tetratricopeptide repeat protein [Bacteroidota bacterium]MDX5469944.1 tetratricopeptide repeat protein [Bacteroidota bacterium]